MPYTVPSNQAQPATETYNLLAIRRQQPSFPYDDILEWHIMCMSDLGASLPAPWEPPGMSWQGSACVWRDESATVTVVPSLQLRLVKELYSLRQPETVSDFLTEHPHLVPLLVEAYFQVAKYFQDEPEVVLEVVTDQEADNYRELFVFIQTTLTPEQAIARLSRFDRDWWLDESHRAQGNLCVHVEFG